MKRVISLIAIIALGLSSAAARQTQPSPKPFTIEDLIKVRRVSDPQLSPNGRVVAYTIADTDKAANKRTSQIYIVSIDGGEPTQLTNDKQSSSSPRWSPDGKSLAFVSARDGASQIWTIEIAEVAAGPLKKITNISTGADGPVWSPDGKWLAFTSEVYPECGDDECNSKREDAAAQSKVRAKIADRLLYRHWNSWKEGKRSHVFLVASTGGAARDMTPGDYDAPPFSLGGPLDYAFSPDSKELAFSRNTDKVEAISTSMYGGTEELWFTEWEFKGTPWTNPEMYAKWSPHMYVKNFKTPTLVINGELDYRVPVTEGLQLFTALQRQGVESKLLYYPDEGHWILKPQNSQLWYETVLKWFDTYLKPRA
jgi:dipeptidyl aminopeptidase/acylaminoacyl peptidase